MEGQGVGGVKTLSEHLHQYPGEIRHLNKGGKEQHQTAQREMSLYMESDGAALWKNRTGTPSSKDIRLELHLQRPQKTSKGVCVCARARADMKG